MSLKTADPYYLLSSVTTTGAGVKVADLTGQITGPAIQVVISATATVQLQASIDRTNWVTLNTLTSSDIYVLDIRGCYFRANVSSYGSGTVSVIVGPGMTIGGHLAVTSGPITVAGGPN